MAVPDEPVSAANLPPADVPRGANDRPVSYVAFADVLLEELARIERRREVILKLASGWTVPNGATPPERGPTKADRRRWDEQMSSWLEEYAKDASGAVRRDDDMRLTAARGLALDQHLAGLAFSGGGIRSATFCIGVLQGLASLKILRFFDMLSTVSGGGYAGGWLAAWLAREGDPINVEKQLSVSRIEQANARRVPAEVAGVRVPLTGKQVFDEEPEPIRHLRQYSSYLNPRPGLFSLDTWTLVAIYTRNVLINLLLLLPMLMVVVLVLRYVLVGFCERPPLWAVGPELLLVVVLAFIALANNALALRKLRLDRGRVRDGQAPDESLPRLVPWAMSYGVVLPLLAAAVALSVAFEQGLHLLRVTAGSLDATDPAAVVVLMGAGLSIWVLFLLGPALLGPLFHRALAGLIAAGLLAWLIHGWGYPLGRQRSWVGAVAGVLAHPAIWLLGALVVIGVLRWRTSLVAGFDLRLMSWGNGSGVPAFGINLVVVGTDNNGLLHIRIFDAAGNRTIDTDETQLPAQAAAVATLKARLPGLLPPHVLTDAEKAQVLAETASIVGQTLVAALAPRRKVLREVLAFSITAVAAYAWIVHRGFLEGSASQLRGFAQGSVKDAYYLSWPNVMLHATVAGMIGGGIGAIFLTERRRQGWLPVATAGFCAGAAGGVMMAVTESLLRFTLDGTQPWLLATIGPPLFLINVVVVALAVFVALLGPTVSESEREWWGRLAGLLMLTATFWAGGMAVVVYGPAVLYAAGSAPSVVLAAAWAGLTTVGVRLGSGLVGAPKGEPVKARSFSSRLVGLILAIAPTVFLVGLLAFVSLLVAYLINEDWNRLPGPPPALNGTGPFFWYFDNYLETLRGTRLHVIGLWLAILAGVSAIATLFVNVNLFSMHYLYANRLTRTFLGASRPRREWADRWGVAGGPRGSATAAGAPSDARGPARQPNPFTGFDGTDEIDLIDLGIGRVLGRWRRSRNPIATGEPSPRYWGPHLILNTALNLVAGEDLAWRDRKAESFALTPLYCGARSTGYALVTRQTRGRLQLGRSVALSGAAVDPNMNQYQSLPLTVLLTIFNARLGAWVQNPSPSGWRAEENPGGAPRARRLPTWTGETGWTAEERSWGARGATASYLLFRELLGSTRGRGPYVHISDGGHFENLGVYELIRRRCRYVVAVDATENPNPSSDNLGILVRLCRVDFGIRLHLDTAPLAIPGADGRSRAHVVMGLIRYDDVDGGAVPGIFVYIRASMTGDEPPDLQQYRDRHPEFPRQWTLTDQSFDEDQFESYRTLGDHIARMVFEEAARAVYEGKDGHSGAGDREWWKKFMNGHGAFRDAHVRLFGELQDRWSDTPLDQDERYLESTRAWVMLHRDLRENPDLAGLSREIYPELDLGVGDAGRCRRAELHTVEQVLQMMEDAWLALGLRIYNTTLPMNRGWMNCFRRLTGTAAFRRFWPILRAEYSPEFVRFCEQQLRLATAGPRLERLNGASSPDVVAMATELAREWPDLFSSRKKQETLEQAGLRYVTRMIRTPAAKVWRVIEEPKATESTERPSGSITVGILAVVPLPDEEGRSKTADYELLLWLRRAHRAMGIGSKVLELQEYTDVEEQILGREKKTLCVRYPRTMASPGDDRLRSQWSSFFALYDFEPPVGWQQRPGEEWALVKKRP
jgi:hypothetical protein